MSGGEGGGFQSRLGMIFVSAAAKSWCRCGLSMTASGATSARSHFARISFTLDAANVTFICAMNAVFTKWSGQSEATLSLADAHSGVVLSARVSCLLSLRM